MNLGNIYGDRFKAIRKRIKINQTDFAKKLNTSQSNISLIEKGERVPPLDLIHELFNIGVTSDYILHGVEPILEEDVKKRKDENAKEFDSRIEEERRKYRDKIFELHRDEILMVATTLPSNEQDEYIQSQIDRYIEESLSSETFEKKNSFIQQLIRNTPKLRELYDHKSFIASIVSALNEYIHCLDMEYLYLETQLYPDDLNNVNYSEIVKKALNIYKVNTSNIALENTIDQLSTTVKLLNDYLPVKELHDRTDLDMWGYILHYYETNVKEKEDRK
ncbi:helix-turn-helix domain-containing protein [Sediminitomix flava]|uniref:Helix-turn-helix protein n=1 Tax=Sediminitomix flava TaxID=379075 RepID=A0A315Z807_SEDFL|nr:helix-turn-helix transcriptional regulator [Sediminitomix flava]PWJ41092.1 helix-turn-helix protein [Sediminitomix flava]